MIKKFVFIVLFFLVIPQHIWPEDRAYKIMEDVFNREDGQDAFFKMEMVLTDHTGAKQKRQLNMWVKDYPPYQKVFIEFESPLDIRDTRFLYWEAEDGNTQYLYLPETGRARRISTKQKKLRFVNSDYNYEDMQRRWPDEDNHRIIKERDECLGSENCVVIESLPKNNSVYTKRISWVDEQKKLILRTDFYGKKGCLIKQFLVLELNLIDGIWTATKTVMKDLANNHETLLNILEVKYNLGISDDKFSLQYLENN